MHLATVNLLLSPSRQQRQKGRTLSTPQRRSFDEAHDRPFDGAHDRPRILIADDDPDTRQGLSDCLHHYGYEPLVAPDGQTALELAAAQPPDLALLDVRMPDLGGLGLAERLWQAQPDLPVILITAYPSLGDGVETMRRGVFYYLPKPLQIGQLLALIEEALAERAARGQSRVRGALTRREKQVLCLIVAGLTNREIAARLTISVATVKRHISNLYKKLDVCNRAQAIRRAQEWELTDPRA